MVRGSRLALAAIFIAAFMVVAPVSAHYRTTGDDVITASPKVLAQLDERRAKAIFFGDRGFYGQCCAGITAAYIRAALILQRLQKPSRDF